MPNLFLLHEDARALARVRRALAEAPHATLSYQLRVVHSFAELAERVRSSAGPSILVDPWYQGAFRGSEIARLLRREDATIVAVAAPPLGAAQDIAKLVGMGLLHWVTLGVDDHPSAIRRALVSGRGARRLEALRQALAPLLDDTMADFVSIVLSPPTPGVLSVGQAAMRLGVSERTLRRRLAGHRRGPPSWWIRWGRLAMAASLAECYEWPADRIARTLGYGDGSNLRRSAEGLVGGAPLTVVELLRVALIRVGEGGGEAQRRLGGREEAPSRSAS